jgi:DNA-binding FrmR family transcriptional regulator
MVIDIPRIGIKGGFPMRSYAQDKENLLNRLKKIEGQVKGIQRMIEEDKYCVDVLVQIAAVRAAINKVGLMIFENHTKTCVAQAMNTNKQEEMINELTRVLVKFVK